MSVMGRPKKVIERTYPRVTPSTEFTLLEIVEMWEKYPEDFITHKDCNYSPEMKQALSKMSMIGLFVGGKTISEKIQETQKIAQAEIEAQILDAKNKAALINDENSKNFNLADLDIAAESSSLYLTLKETLKTFDKMETNEKVQILRTATSLMEKLLTLQEKAVAVSQYSQFKTIVMNMMDRYLNPVQIAELVKELEDLNSQV